MPKRSSKPKKDENEIAKSVVDAATTPAEPQLLDVHAAAAALGRRGGLKGGPARAKKLSAQRRTAIARGAAMARHHGKKRP